MPRAVDGLKTCTGCGTTKPVDQFHTQSALVDGLNPKCKPCRKVVARRRYDADTERLRESQIWRTVKYKYGITRDQYEAKLADQGGGCAICKKPDLARGHTKLCIDHNHETGEVRGLLCVTCNLAIGYMRDDLGLLESAADYLRKWSPSR